jgi:hypothetical protein
MFLNIMLIGHTKICGSMLFCGSVVILGQYTHAAVFESSIHIPSFLASTVYLFSDWSIQIVLGKPYIVMKQLGI